MAKQCPKAGACGSCQYNGVKYSTQLKEKQEYVNSLLCKFGPVAPIYPMADPFYYRNKIQSVFGYNSKGEVISGIYRQGTHSIIPVNGCMLEDKVADDVLRTVKFLVKRLGISIYDEDARRGFLRHVLIKRALATGQIMVVLIAGSERFPQSKVFIRELLNEHPDITTVLLNKNNEKTSMVLSDLPEKVLYGDGYITDVLCGLRFRISAKSFYQVNPIQAAKLYTAAMKMARFTGKEKVIDAYCGTGTIGLIASHWGAGEVIGIELNPDAVQDAENNAKINNITNASFICGDAGDVLKQMAKNKETADVVFLDPPRAGSDEKFLASVIKLNPKTVIYISCNPQTLERDLRYITKMGPFQVVGSQPVDMFPQTSHVETCVLLVREQYKDSRTASIKVDLDGVNIKQQKPLAEPKPTYDNIKKWVKENYGFEVSSLYIAQTKDKSGIKERENYNIGDGKGIVPKCPPEKEAAIMEAFKHFKMI